jgi:2-desacetyl-2-hydroxyethyl bacteriochlorophyllide A dehydrogenase
MRRVKQNLETFRYRCALDRLGGVTATETAAILVRTPSDVGFAVIPIEPPGPGDVLIGTHYSGVSTGTDTWVMRGVFEWDHLTFPLVPGYQRSGIVEDAAPGWERGQRVAATRSVGLAGAAAHWGAHLAVASSPQEEVFDAEGVDPVAASLFVSAQVGVNAASRITAPAGARVMVIGDGIIGSSGALAAVARGFDVLVIGHRRWRLDALAELGVTVLDSAADGDRIPDFEAVAAIDTVQSDESFGYCIDVLPHGTGQIVYSGHTPDTGAAWADLTRLQQRELTAHFVSGWTRDRLTRTLQLMREGALPVERLVGQVAGSDAEVTSLMARVVAGELEPTAAAIDWSFAR